MSGHELLDACPQRRHSTLSWVILDDTGEENPSRPTKWQRDKYDTHLPVVVNFHHALYLRMSVCRSIDTLSPKAVRLLNGGARQ